MNDFPKMFVDPLARHVAHVVEEGAPPASDCKVTFVLRLQPEPRCHYPILALRRVLKYALRACHLRCVDAQEISATPDASPNKLET